MKKSEPPIIVEETFDTSAETVWSALTVIEQMRQWYFGGIPSFRPEVGFEIVFDVSGGERVFPHRWRVTEVEPGRKISYNWKYDGYAGDSLLTFELFRENNRTRLRLTHRVLEDFQAGIPEFTRESGLAGWKYFINERLKAFLVPSAARDQK